MGGEAASDAGIIAFVVDVVSAALLAGGGFFYLVGAIGMNRMPDVFTRMHAASVSESLGIGLLFAGMILQAGFSLVAVKLVAILALLWLTAPLATHALARAALFDGQKPVLDDGDGRLAKTDPATLYDGLGARLGTAAPSQRLELPGRRTAEGPLSNS